MANQLEYFDVLTNSQKQVFDNLLSIQKDLRVQWIEAIGKVHAAFTSIPSILGLQEIPLTKEVENQFNTWFSTVASNSQSASDEALKIQGNWIATYEKQLAVSRDVLKSFIDIASPVKADIVAPTKAKAKAA
jgi:hypothetical protein